MFENFKKTRAYNLVLPIQKLYELWSWKNRGKTPPTPHLIKERMVTEYGEKHNLYTLVETGTYLGVMISAQKNNFDSIYSVELDRNLANMAKEKFGRYQNIKILEGDSAKVLSKIIAKLNEPALFWLDAHYSGGITSKGKKYTPILDELKLILKHKQKHIILIDDAHLFVGKNGYPSIDDLKKIIKNRRKIKVENSIIIIS